MGEEEMKFFKKELCIKLQKLGCVTRSCFLYISSKDKTELMAEGEDVNTYFSLNEIVKITEKIPAFTIYDFLSDEDYAEENCRKIDTEHEGDIIFRRDILDAENQEAYIEEAVNKILTEE